MVSEARPPDSHLGLLHYPSTLLMPSLKPPHLLGALNRTEAPPTGRPSPQTQTQNGLEVVSSWEIQKQNQFE